MSNKDTEVKEKKRKVAKNVEIPDRLLKGRANKICYILIEELSGWESSTKVTTEEFIRLVDKLIKVK